MENSGLIHVYYGNGKGKTTAALGLALRASGCGKKVVVLQFLKDMKCGELSQLALLPNTVVLRGKAGAPFTFSMTQEEKDATKVIHDDNLRQALALVGSGECDMLVLDEALDAYQLGLLDEVLLTELIRSKPPALELVITGHSPTDWIVDAADYVTEMVKVKHPYDRGIMARRGVEF